jgi:hypothetical protein
MENKMTPEQFTYWLKGFYELNEPESINEKQTLIIKDHLDLVFGKVTPNRSDNTNDMPLSKNVPLSKRSSTRYC